MFNLFKPAPQGDATPSGPPVKKVTFAEKVASLLHANLYSYLGKREKDKNRGEWVDEINNFTGASLGSPYCLSGILFNLNKTEKDINVKFDLPKTASTQSFIKRVKPEYLVKDPEPFCIGIMRQKDDPDHGHAVYIDSYKDDKGNFHTYEFNTGPDGGRDGDGFYSKVRNVAGDKSKIFVGYVSLTKALKEI